MTRLQRVGAQVAMADAYARYYTAYVCDLNMHDLYLHDLDEFNLLWEAYFDSHRGVGCM